MFEKFNTSESTSRFMRSVLFVVPISDPRYNVRKFCYYTNSNPDLCLKMRALESLEPYAMNIEKYLIEQDVMPINKEFHKHIYFLLDESDLVLGHIQTTWNDGWQMSKGAKNIFQIEGNIVPCLEYLDKERKIILIDGMIQAMFPTVPFMNYCIDYECVHSLFKFEPSKIQTMEVEFFFQSVPFNEAQMINGLKIFFLLYIILRFSPKYVQENKEKNE